MKPHLVYRNRTAGGWTRIDMLLAIYDAVIRALDQGIASAMNAQARVQPQHRLHTQKLLLLLLEGIDLKAGPSAESMQQLVIFCIEQVDSESSQDWVTARKILNGLREAFLEIRDEARRLEQTGQIPHLDWAASTPELALA